MAKYYKAKRKRKQNLQKYLVVWLISNIILITFVSILYGTANHYYPDPIPLFWGLYIGLDYFAVYWGLAIFFLMNSLAAYFYYNRKKGR